MHTHFLTRQEFGRSVHENALRLELLPGVQRAAEAAFQVVQTGESKWQQSMAKR
jgi:hypothetical protein